MMFDRNVECLEVRRVVADAVREVRAAFLA